MKKKHISITLLILALFLGVFMLHNLSYALADETRKEGLFSVQYYENSNNSLAVYNDAIRLYRNINKTSGGETVITYSDDYAGSYIDEDGFLNIGYVGYLKAVSNFNGQVLYKKNNFSYNYLQEVQSKLIDIMLDYDIYMTGIDEKQNHVSIYLANDSTIQQILDYLKSEYGVNEKALDFIVDSKGRTIKNSIAYGGRVYIAYD